MDTKFVTTMYDTVNFILFKEDYPDIDFIEDIPQFLNSITSTGESNQGCFITGFAETYKVSINPNRVKIHNSSLARYINDDNQQGMSLQQTRKALQKMSDKLHLNLDKAKVTRIDVGKNIITKQKPEIYLPYLGELNGYKKLESGDGLYYKNSLRELVFYNKIKEQKQKRKEIQPIFKDHHLIRYEYRLMNHLEKQLNIERVTGELLYDEAFYINIAKRWRDEYLKIAKKSNKTQNIIPTSSTREMILNLAAITVQNLGDEEIIRIIAEWQDQKIVNKKQASDHRLAIRQIVNREMKSTGNDLIEELDKKIKESIRFFK